MQVPEGFQVELVAAEPDIVNPVAMTFDERGRIWITESLEYPRKSAGPGRDRIKVLEDTDGDGKADRFTIFADGLNIPSGIAVGHGGVWVANSPDILFLQDTDGDGKADRREVVVTGFGRSDTHELPNSLNWGPDGWLYGLNGVFNASHVHTGGKDYKFTCAMFRIHPRTREFQIFCEGTSNPWGIAWDDVGSSFVSACVIDHLWHLTETGYYHRQGGPYPPFTWEIGSIVEHKHQRAAYAGLHFFDSDVYPPEYREKLYMGNIHGGCVNVDVLSRDGSTYKARPQSDFLTANDAWFMPVSQKTGPDGCLYILDWYDRYHCYQDAERDPKGIDRLKGRLYRVRYKQTPRVPSFDLAKETDDALIGRLDKVPNEYYRSTIVRLLAERRDPNTRPKLERRVLDKALSLKARFSALWAILGSDALSETFLTKLLLQPEPELRAWGVRAAGNRGRVSTAVRERIVAAAHDPSADVRLQAAIAARKVEGVDAVAVLIDVLANSSSDPLIPHIVWNNLQPLVEQHSGPIARALAQIPKFDRHPSFAEFVPRLFERLLAARDLDRPALRELFLLVLRSKHPEAARQSLQFLTARVQTRELTGDRLQIVREAVRSVVASVLKGPRDGQLFFDVALLAASWREPAGIETVRGLISDSSLPAEQRLAALNALVAANDESVLVPVQDMLKRDTKVSPRFASRLISALGKLDSARVADLILTNYSGLDSAVQPAAIELLTGRVAWSKKLLDSIGAGQIPRSAVNLSQIRKLLAFGDRDLADRVRAKWGTVRDQRSPQRELVILQMKRLIQTKHGDAAEGEKVFRRICAQCHRIYGEGVDVGPDLTVNGRSSVDQMLSNVFDPSLVIGAAYRAVIVVTKEGRVLTGLVAEDSPSRLVLKIQGGKTEIIPREDVDSFKTSNVSLMPEQLENQLKPNEIVDLFAFLALDKRPSDPTARQLPGLK
jgi:putative membrane-bound dehydrogenase-like protein